MNLWGATPLLVAALLGGGHAAANPAASPHSAPPARPGPTPQPASLGSQSAVLSPAGHGGWQTTVLLNRAILSHCPKVTNFALETVAPTKAIPAAPSPAAGAGSPCRYISLKFSGLTQIPDSAVLVFRAPGGSVTAIPASFSRPVSIGLYFVVPAGVGLALLAALFLLAIFFVKIYDRAGARVRPFRTREGNVRWNAEFWQWTVMASGAWTVSDSWATNIATVTAVLGTVLGATAATSTIFPGIALDRFTLVNLLIGGLITAVPLAFAILYARWTARYPGPTADTTIAPQVPLAKGADLVVAETALITSRATTQHQSLPSGSTIRLRQETFAIVTDGSPVSLAPVAPDPIATLAAGTVIAPIPGTRDDEIARLIRAHSPLAADAKVRLVTSAVLPPPHPPFGWIRIRSGQQAIITADVHCATPGEPVLPAGTRVDLPGGAVAKFDTVPAMAGISPVHRKATLPREARVTLVRRADGAPAATNIRIRGQCKVTLTGSGPAGTAAVAQQALNQDPAIGTADRRPVSVTAPGGATITLPGGAALGAIDSPERWPLQVKDGTTLQVPPGSKIDVLTGSQITMPGSSDLLIGGETAIQISGTAGLIAVAAESVAPAPKRTGPQAQGTPGNPQPGHVNPGQADHQDKPAPTDTPLACPVFLAAPAGAKITVVGTADVELPAGLAMTAPRRNAYALRRPLHLTVPQPANTLGASMRLVIVAAMLTMFGVGAQLGLAGVLVHFSDASTDGSRVAFGLIGLVAVFLLYYSTTAIRSLADPQPGSSMSAVPGTSFTL